jgi:hypothetical protein
MIRARQDAELIDPRVEQGRRGRKAPSGRASNYYQPNVPALRATETRPWRATCKLLATQQPNKAEILGRTETTRKDESILNNWDFTDRQADDVDPRCGPSLRNAIAMMSRPSIISSLFGRITTGSGRISPVTGQPVPELPFVRGRGAEGVALSKASPLICRSLAPINAVSLPDLAGTAQATAGR